MADHPSVVSAPPMSDEYDSWHSEVLDKFAPVGVKVLDAQAIAPNKMTFELTLTMEALDCCEIAAVLEGDAHKFYVTVKRPYS